MIIPFKQYLHDEWKDDNLEDIFREASVSMTSEEIDDLYQKMGRPFYEVTLSCTLDTETGEVKVLDVKL